MDQQRSKLITAERFIQAADIVEQVKNKRKEMRELELELGRLHTAEARSVKERQKVTAGHQQKLTFTRPDANKDDLRTASVKELSPGSEGPDQNTAIKAQDLHIPSSPALSLTKGAKSVPRE